MIIAQNVFPVIIAKTKWQDRHLLGEAFDKEINDILNNVPEDRKIDTAKGEYSTTIRQFNDIMNLPSVYPFRKWAESVMKDLWREIGYEDCDIAIERSWINQFFKGSKLGGHAHGSTEMVMTYYHKMPAGSSAITFYNPFEGQTGMAPYRQKLVTIQPEEGDLLAWPGFLWHEVEEQPVDGGRMAISMHVHQGSYALADRWRKIS